MRRSSLCGSAMHADPQIDAAVAVRRGIAWPGLVQSWRDVVDGIDVTQEEVEEAFTEGKAFGE